MPSSPSIQRPTALIGITQRELAFTAFSSPPRSQAKAWLRLNALCREGTLRYGQLQHTVQRISQKMLTQTLRELERNGLIRRTVYTVVPPQVEYELTELGDRLRQVLSGLCGWAQDNLAKVAQARELYNLGQPSKVN